MLYSGKTGGFYDRAIHLSTTIPDDVVEITNSEYMALLDGQARGKQIAPDTAGRPTLLDPPPAPLTREQIEALRLRAYADPLTGSDRHFAEAIRLQVMGATTEEIDAAKSAGAVRYAEIQAQYPWPDDI